MKHLMIGVALAAALPSTPVEAAQKRRDIGVAIADLDLGTQAGRAELDRRIAVAAAKACGTAYYLDSEGLKDVDRCRADAIQRAKAASEAHASRDGAS